MAACAFLLSAGSGFQLCQNHSSSAFITCLGSGLPVYISFYLLFLSGESHDGYTEAHSFQLALQRSVADVKFKGLI